MGQFERGYGLIIGVSAYSDPAWDAPVAERDAQAIAAALTDPQAGGYPPGQVELLTGAPASGGAVLKALERLAARADRGDTVFIAITSHGAQAENDIYTLATSDAQFVGDRIKGDTGLTIAQLARALKQIRAERLLLVINACFAGSASRLATQGGLREAPGSALPNAAGDELLGSGKGRALITASRPDQRSYFQDEDDHSIFGQALIDGLRGVGISKRSGYIGLFELYDRIYTQVGKLAALRGQLQEPVLNLVEGVGAFPVALHSGAEHPDDGALQAQPTAAGVRIAQLNIDNSTNIAIDNRNFGTNFGNAQTGDVHIRDSAAGNINDVTIGDVGNIDTLIDRILPKREGIFPTIVFPSLDPPPIDPTTPPDGGAPLIDLGNAQIGSFTIKGDVVRGNVSKTVYNQGGTDDADELDPLGELQKIRARVEQARNVDEDARDDAAGKIKQAHRALDQGDRARALQRIAEALDIMDALNNGYLNSIAKKLRAVRDSL